MTLNHDTIELAGVTKEEKLSEEKKQINTALNAQHKKWFDNLPFFIISLVFATGTFIGGYFVRMNVLADSIIQAIVFVITVGFFVVPLSWLFNKLWQLFLKEK
ncbi:MAG: hypothetical protein KGD64_09245 [Candidatus Heimdallarchaeota archaeon]|nr:hypothetical protein [Candidatus Heimdallarchaeota archaeon]